MKRTRVLIATTQGPSAVQRITAEDPDVRSVVCLDGKAMALPISHAYEQFVRDPTGLIERQFGHPSFRMDVEHPIEDGASWQLGVLVAHALEAAGCLAGKGVTPDRVVWCTGEVDRDLAVRPVAHVAEKMERSEDAIMTAVANGRQVLIMLPRANLAEAAPSWLAELRGDVRVVPVDDAGDACRSLGAPIGSIPDGKVETVARPRPGMPSFLSVSVLALASVLAVLAWILFGTIDRSPTVPPSPIPQVKDDGKAAPPSAPLVVGVAELRRADGGECPPEAELGRLASRSLAVGEQGRIPNSQLSGLCGLRFTLRSREPGRHLWAFAQMVPERVFLLADTHGLRADPSANGEASWTVELPPGRTKPLRYVFVAMSSPDPLTDAATLLPRHIDWSGETSINHELKALAAELEGRGITLVIAAHEILP